MKDSSTFRITVCVILWIVLLILLGYIGYHIVPVSTVNQGLSYLERWSNWDGRTYLSIAQDGYGATGQISYAFFPGYPLVVYVVSQITGSVFVAGWLVSGGALILAIHLWYQHVKLEYDRWHHVASCSILMLLTFPTAFFLLATYTESFFLVTVLASCLLYRNKRYMVSGIAGLVAAATRITGVALLAFFAVEIISYVRQSRSVSIVRISTKDSSKENRKSRLVGMLISPMLTLLGLISYMVYLWYQTGDAFAFLTLQQEAYGRSQITYPIKPLLAYLYDWIMHPHNVFATWMGSVIFFDFVVSVVFLCTIIAGLFLPIRRSYLAYSIVAWSLPLMTGMTSSMSRYVLILFPSFIVPALLFDRLGKQGTVNVSWLRWLSVVWIILSYCLMTALAICFIGGYWIA
ncbi:MAG: hypothetical protein ACOCXQ_03860 [Patescibacteria group bacterium]